MLAIIAQPDGTLEEVQFEKHDYAVFSEAVKGLVEAHYYSDDLEHYHNEEFLYAEGEVFQSPNFIANVLSEGLVFYGPVIYFGGIDDEGYSRGLSAERAEQIRIAARFVERFKDVFEQAAAHMAKPEPSFTITTW